MRGRPRYWGVSFFLLGLAVWALLPLAWLKLDDHFKLTEPTFLSPVNSKSKQIILRHDVYGKGYFGATRNGGRRHKGIDILCPVSQPILSAKSGRVTFAGEDVKGYGLYVEIAHPDGLRTRYAHLKKIEVE